LICDLENNQPIEVLPDREVETVSAWFENHPTVEIVSRDRSSEYAAAIRKGAPQALQVADLEEVVFGLFPRKIITERGDAAEIIQELRAFWQFLQLVHQLPQARQMLAHLTPQATRRLERELQEPANFGMAESFVLMGKEAGFDMELPEGMQAWVKTYNATVAPAMAATDPASKKKSRGVPTSIRSAQRRKRKPTRPHERREP
jgi:Transposase